VQYVDGHFVDSYYPTIENTFSKVIRYRNHDFAVEMIDTAGQDEYSILNSKHFIGIHGYMIVYSVGSKQSFEMVRIIRDKILNHLVRFFTHSITTSPSFHARANVAQLYHQ
jgi:Ras family protein